jgi:2-C-methyl-D-erythritol 2,4-cyclodiphosphate synthase
MNVRTGLGQDSHRFESEGEDKPLLLAGVGIEGAPGLEGNSDADVVLHALVNAISGVTGVVVLGKKTDEMSQAGINDSREYVKEALKHLGALKLTHVSVSLECQRPKIAHHIDEMRASMAALLGLTLRDIAISATSGEGLTSFGKGLGIQALVIVTAMEP